MFISFYLKVYPTYEPSIGYFGVDKSRVCRWIKELMPMLESILERSSMRYLKEKYCKRFI